MITVVYDAPHLVLSPAIRTYIEDKLGRLEKYAGRIYSARVIARRDVHHRHGQVASVRILVETLKGSATAKAEAPDFLAAVDLVQEKLERQLVRRPLR